MRILVTDIKQHVFIECTIVVNFDDVEIKMLLKNNKCVKIESNKCIFSSINIAVIEEALDLFFEYMSYKLDMVSKCRSIDNLYRIYSYKKNDGSIFNIIEQNDIVSIVDTTQFEEEEFYIE